MSTRLGMPWLTSERWRYHRLVALVAIATVAGIALRLALPAVFTYLDDERWTFEHIQAVRSGAEWPWLGMPSSNGVRNPPMSVWVFVALGGLARAVRPSDLTRAVAVLAIVAHLSMLVIPLRLVRTRQERAIWLWAFALTMTNPIVVFLERKIWAQSVLPIVDIGLLCAWMLRETSVGAFAWGVLGTLTGQIHMAGFFFAPALPAFTLWGARSKRTRWAPWCVGSVIGGLPALPWILYLIHEHPRARPAPWWLRFRLEFYEYFFSDPSALCTPYIVGNDAWLALAYPRPAGYPTYLVGFAFVALAVASGVIACRAMVYAWTLRSKPLEWSLGDRSDTAIAVSAAILGMGVLMTLPSISIYRHYMLALFPLPYVWTARAALRRPGGEKWLAVLFFGGLLVSVGILSFLADNDGAQDFGKSWAAQVRDGTSADEAKRFRGGGT